MPESVSEALLAADFPYRQLIERMPAPLAIFAQGAAIFVNDAARCLMEAEAKGELLGKSIADFVHPEDRELVMARVTSLLGGEEIHAPIEIRLLTRRGHMRRILTSSMAMTVNEQPLIVVIAADDTRRMETEIHLRENEESFQQLFSSTQDVYYRTDAEDRLVRIAPTVHDVLGYHSEEMIGDRLETYCADSAEGAALQSALRNQGTVKDFAARMVRHDGSLIDVSVSGYVVYDDNGKFLGTEGIWRDVSDRKNLERELRRLATTDPLTGIANRRAFLESASDALNHANRRRDNLVLLALDLDLFKAVNDRHGHLAGDQVLIHFVQAVNAELRDADLFGRLGGEEFGIILRQISREEASKVAERIVRCIRALEFADHEGSPYGVTASIGATANHRNDKGIERLLARADMALYAAKEAGRDCIRWWEP